MLCYYFWQENADISKIKEILELKVIFSELHVCLYLGTKFQISGLILMSFTQGGGVLPPPPENETLRSSPKLELKPGLNCSSSFVLS